MIKLYRFFTFSQDRKSAFRRDDQTDQEKHDAGDCRAYEEGINRTISSFQANQSSSGRSCRPRRMIDFYFILFLLVSQGFDGRKERSFIGRVIAEKDPHQSGETKRDQYGYWRNRGGPPCKGCN